MPSSVDSILDNAVAGERLDESEIQSLFDHGELLALGQAAAAVRRGKNPGEIGTYIVAR